MAPTAGDLFTGKALLRHDGGQNRGLVGQCEPLEGDREVRELAVVGVVDGEHQVAAAVLAEDQGIGALGTALIVIAVV